MRSRARLRAIDCVHRPGAAYSRRRRPFARLATTAELSRQAQELVGACRQAPGRFSATHATRVDESWIAFARVAMWYRSSRRRRARRVPLRIGRADGVQTPPSLAPPACGVG